MKYRFGISVVLVGAAFSFNASSTRAQAPAPEPAGVKYVCPPCSFRCHQEEFDSQAKCAKCGMALVDSATVPHVGILVFDGIDLLSFAGPASVFAQSNRALVFTVADTADPINSQEVITFTPRHSFDDAPPCDILIIAGGDGIRDIFGDSYITDWVKERVEAADHVLCVGSGLLILHATGALEGKAVPFSGMPARQAEQLLPGVTIDTERRYIDHGKIKLALDDVAAIHAALQILGAVADPEIAARTAQRIGFEFPNLPNLPDHLKQE